MRYWFAVVQSLLTFHTISRFGSHPMDDLSRFGLFGYLDVTFYSWHGLQVNLD
jgi:hypothetical protein